MKRGLALFALAGIVILSSCSKKENTEAPKADTAPAAAQPASGPHAFVHLKDGSKVPGTIVASSQTDMVVAGDDGIERKIPMEQVKSVEYGGAPSAQADRKPPASAPGKAPEQSAPGQPAQQASAPPPPPPAVTTRT
jgi:hypothetical protein